MKPDPNGSKEDAGSSASIVSGEHGGTKLEDVEARLAEALEQQVATSEILGVISSSPHDLQPVFAMILTNSTRLCRANVATLWLLDGDVLVSVANQNASPEFVEYLAHARIRPGRQSTTRRAALERRTIHLTDLLGASDYEPSVFHKKEQVRTVLSVPLMRGTTLIGVLTLWRREVNPFTLSQVALVESFARQAVIAIENARLFREIEDKSRQLASASRQKSEFLSNMSHELRTPLNAIMGFSEVLAERMFGEVNDKQAEYLSDILESGQHLLSLINDILDLSKIEAGRMELEATDVDLRDLVQHSLLLVKERAQRRAITIEADCDSGPETIRADERKLRQVLLNLLSNALKFTPDGGRIRVRANPCDGGAEISVTDTGVGIASEDLEAVFEEFRQVGAASKKIEGTGLGLAISRKFVELHGGTISVRSRPGAGSTFTFTVPQARV